jgi:hypothetical protein
MWQFAATHRLLRPTEARTPADHSPEPDARDFLRAFEEALREVQIEAEAQAWLRDLQADLQGSTIRPS